MRVSVENFCRVDINHPAKPGGFNTYAKITPHLIRRLRANEVTAINVELQVRRLIHAGGNHVLPKRPHGMRSFIGAHGKPDDRRRPQKEAALINAVG